MKHVHIALVGGQPVPVYIGIKNDTASRSVVLVCSDRSKMEAERIKLQFADRDIIIKECSATDLHLIEDFANNLLNQYSTCDITLNLTSGIKLWALFFFKIFSTVPNVRFIYVDQTNNISDLGTKQTDLGQIETAVRFALYGADRVTFCPLSDYTPQDFEVLRKIESLRRINKKSFNELTMDKADEVKQRLQGELYATDESFIKFDLDEHLAEVSITSYSGYHRFDRLCCDHLVEILFNNGWFELKVAITIRDNHRVKDVWLNCVINDSQGNPKNEVDVIADFGTRLLFVECKTMIYDITDIDKFRSALRNFGGTGSMGVFVTNDRPSRYTQNRYAHAMEKCKDNNIHTFNYALWNEDRSKDTLNDIINKELSKQNIR